VLRVFVCFLVCVCVCVCVACVCLFVCLFVCVRRHFGNKLWNATKFAMMHLEGYTPGPLPARSELSTHDKWILHRLNAATADANIGMEEFDFAKATTAIYSFFLYDLCDNFLEMSKPVFDDKSSAAAKASQAVLHTCLEQGFRLLHPFMPFVTEELWQRLARSPGP
jgi:valyl-tRNA synthetase